MKSGPKPFDFNIKRLIARRVALQIVPVGCKNPQSRVISAIMGNGLTKEYRTAEVWVHKAIEVIRKAAEPNPWKHMTDDEIAGEVLRQVEERDKHDAIRKAASGDK